MIGTAIAGAAAYGAKKLDENFGPKGENPPVGTSVEHEGKEFKVIGWFGASENTIKNIDTTRELYFGSKKEAQGYAMNRGKQADPNPQVVMLLAKEFPKSEDLGPPRFDGGPNPITPEGLKRLNVKLVKPELVNKDTQIGFVPNMIRYMNSKKEE